MLPFTHEHQLKVLKYQQEKYLSIEDSRYLGETQENVSDIEEEGDTICKECQSKEKYSIQTVVYVDFGCVVYVFGVYLKGFIVFLLSHEPEMTQTLV